MMTQEENIPPYLERKLKSAGIIMNGAAQQWAESLKKDMQSDVSIAMELYAERLQKGFWRACFSGVILVFGVCLTVAWAASKTDSRVRHLETDTTEVGQRLDSIETKLNQIELKIPNLTLGIPSGIPDDE